MLRCSRILGRENPKKGLGAGVRVEINHRMSWLKDAGCCSLSGHLSRQISAVFSHFTKHNSNAHRKEIT